LSFGLYESRSDYATRILHLYVSTIQIYIVKVHLSIDNFINIYYSIEMNLTFGEKLSILRKRKGVSQDQLSKVLEINFSNLTHYESDKYKPSYDKMIKIAEYFDVSLDLLLKD
jgi:DNA-binding XRE family transcriptional regulator